MCPRHPDTADGLRATRGLLILGHLGGAVATHVLANDGMFWVPVLIGDVARLGLCLRDRKLRALVPIVAE